MPYSSEPLSSSTCKRVEFATKNRRARHATCRLTQSTAPHTAQRWTKICVSNFLGYSTRRTLPRRFDPSVNTQTADRACSISQLIRCSFFVFDFGFVSPQGGPVYDGSITTLQFDYPLNAPLSLCSNIAIKLVSAQRRCIANRVADCLTKMNEPFGIVSIRFEELDSQRSLAFRDGEGAEVLPSGASPTTAALSLLSLGAASLLFVH